MSELSKLSVGELLQEGVTHYPEAQYYQYDVSGILYGFSLIS